MNYLKKLFTTIKINAKMLWIYILIVELIFSQLGLKNEPCSYLKFR